MMGENQFKASLILITLLESFSQSVLSFKGYLGCLSFSERSNMLTDFHTRKESGQMKASDIYQYETQT